MSICTYTMTIGLWSQNLITSKQAREIFGVEGDLHDHAEACEEAAIWCNDYRPSKRVAKLLSGDYPGVARRLHDALGDDMTTQLRDALSVYTDVSSEGAE